MHALLQAGLGIFPLLSRNRLCCHGVIRGARRFSFASQRDLPEVSGASRLPLSPTRITEVIRSGHPGSRSGGVFAEHGRGGSNPPPVLLATALLNVMVECYRNNVHGI